MGQPAQRNGSEAAPDPGDPVADRPARSLVIPMYQEAARIVGTIHRLAGSCLDAPGTELILVDDGSVDGTAELAEKALAESGLRAELLRHPVNRGKGAAVRTGVLHASGARIAFADADLSADIAAIEEAFAAVVPGSADVVVATRAASASTITVPESPLRQAGGKMFNRVIRVAGLTGMSDTQCGLKAFTRTAARELFEALTIERFAFDVEVLLRAEARGFAVRELPIEWRYVPASRVRLLRDSTRMLTDVIRLRRRLGAEPSAAPPATTDATTDPMPARKFDVMSRLEREHWWFRAKQELVREHARTAAGRAVAVDVGCGTGAVVSLLADDCGFRVAVGTDLSRYALTLAAPAAGPTGAFAAARAEQLPFRTGSVDVLTSLDVVEHLDDDVLALREYARVLAPGGVVCLSVPAYRWAWSDHDVVLGHRRRYTRRRLVAAAREAGLDVQRCTYFHSWLAPVALLVRRTPVRRLVRKEAEEASFVSPAVNRALLALGRAERAALRRLDLPFGLSVFLVARPGAAAQQATPEEVTAAAAWQAPAA
jgi:dolichyl-phosphate beta-glucosyltransferase